VVVNFQNTFSKSNRISGGLLMYRLKNMNLEVLISHPGGPFFYNKDDGHWTIPKGEPDSTEDIFLTAIREFKEETGIVASGEFIDLGFIIQKGGKKVFCWAFYNDSEPDPNFVSNTFTVEWPLYSGKFQDFPEVDKTMFFEIEQARTKIKDTQIQFLDRLINYLNNNNPINN